MGNLSYLNSCFRIVGQPASRGEPIVKGFGFLIHLSSDKDIRAEKMASLALESVGMAFA
jgi:hypothetical protein